MYNVMYIHCISIQPLSPLIWLTLSSLFFIRPPPPSACHHREDRGRWSGGQGPGSQRPPHEAGQNHALLQEKQTSHLLLLGERRVQERGRMSLQVRGGAVSLNLQAHNVAPRSRLQSHTLTLTHTHSHIHVLSHSHSFPQARDAH